MTAVIRGRQQIAIALIAGAALAGLVVGWRLFWFLTDDAYISFRYVGNSMLGYGYVWNPPPFLPVEGYTSFLWVVLLDLAWRLTGLAPPLSANLLALAWSAGTVLLTLALLFRAASAPALAPVRLPLVTLGLVGVLSNRTFLAWTSSGLETALFNCLLTLWLCCALCLPPGGRAWALGLAFSAALCALTRPDGLLFTAVTLGLLALAWFSRWRRGGLRPLALLAGAPLLLVPAHLLWRHWFYGEWLPNTYYAKSSSDIDRLASGSRYLLTFVIEYCLWIWLALAAALAAMRIVGALRRRPAPADPGPPGDRMLRRLVVAAVVLTILGQAGYYTFLIGGDHFEFRVYSQLIPLIFISFVWMLGALRLRPAAALALLAAFVVFSWPVPWSHWAASQRAVSRDDTTFLKVALADELGPKLPWATDYLRWYDDMQFWLIDHAICLRHQEHKSFHLYLVGRTLERGESSPPPGVGVPLMTFSSVGVISYRVPWLGIIDVVGLNDYVIARNPTLSGNQLMAHEHQPPPGYLDCFSPDLSARRGEVIFVPPARIITCEARFRSWVQAQSPSAATPAP